MQTIPKCYAVVLYLFLAMTVVAAAVTAQSAPQPAGSTKLPQGVSEDWWSGVQQDIGEREYHVTRQDDAGAVAVEAVWQAPNRAQDLRTHFTEHGPRVIRRTGPQSDWMWGLELVSLNGAAAPAVKTCGAEANRFEYVRDNGVTEWYVNDSRGLEQGFTLSQAPASGDKVVLDLGVRGNLHGGMMAGDDAVEFLSSEGVGVIHFGGLKAWDASGQTLGGCMEMVGDDLLRISVDVTGAVYPVTIDPLAAAAAWTAESNQASAAYGASVATAGDVNGDGYSDVIVGAPLYDGSQADGGAAFLYLGSASGLVASAAWSVQGGQTGCQFGASVSTAGDVNKDGFDDIVVGAYNYDVNADTFSEGKVSVYNGSATGPGVSANWTGVGGMAGEAYGRSVAPAGDVNGDGYSDLLVGASGYANGAADEGRAYCYHGSATGLSAASNWAYESNKLSAYLGWVVATAGDVNGDGYSDALVTAYGYTNGEANEGAAFVFYGSGSGLSATYNWIMEANLAGASFGYAAGTAGDVNGDGYADIIVGAPQYNAGFAGEGMAFVYHGSAAGPALTPNWRGRGNAAGLNLGWSVGTAGDVNADGYADIIVGVPNYINGQANEGAVFGWFGSSVGLFATPPQATPDLPASRDWLVESNQVGANLGHSVATAGDVNGDGYADVIASALNYDNPEVDEGRAFVFYGSAGVPLASVYWLLDPVNEANANYGYSVASAGDVNGDGFSDIIVGAPYYDGSPAIADQGIAYLYLGTATGLGLSPAWSRMGGLAGALFGYCVAGGGDLNGDGYADVVVGAPGYTNGQVGEGRVVVYHGSAIGLAGAFRNIEIDVAGAAFGASVAGAGDVNGDGFSDLIVGAPNYANGETDEGRVYVYYGRAAGVGAAASWGVESNVAGALMGNSVAGAGDVNADGYDDVVVGSRGAANGGAAYTYHGAATGLPLTPAWTGGCAQAGANYGVCVSGAGDVNGDGYSDVIIGANLYQNTLAGEGRVFVCYGSGAGIAGAPQTFNGAQLNAQMGKSIAGAGDVNGDGYSDVIIGLPLMDQGATIDEGRVYVLKGSAVGAGALLFNGRPASSGIQFGYCVAGTGDINGDGFSDFITGAPYFGTAPVGEGRVFAYYGNTESGGRGQVVKPRQTKTDGTLLGPEGVSDTITSARVLMFARTPFGRAKVAMQVELKPVGVLFDGTGLKTTVGWTDTLSTGVDIARVVGNLAISTPYHWRARLAYQSASVPFQEYSRWYSPPWNATTENDFRTATPPKDPTNAGATAITTNSITWTWSDNSSDETGFKVWTGPGSADPLVQQALTAANATSLVYGGLQTNTQYAFQVAASAGVGDSGQTPTFAAWTAAAVATAPVVSGATATSLNVRIGLGDGNPSYTVYAIHAAPSVSGNNWVQADGSVGAVAVYRTAADWGTMTVTGLAGYTVYDFTVVAQNGGGMDSGSGPPGTGSTLDQLPPTGTLVINGGAPYTGSTAVTLALTGDDAGGSGVTHMRFSVDNVSWSGWEPFALTRSFTLTGADGSHTVYVQFGDAVGNISIGDISDAIVLDRGLPTGTISINGASPCTGTAAVTLDLSFDDGTGSGVADMRFSEDGVTWTAWEPVATPRAFVLSGTDGPKTVNVAFRDLAGNESAGFGAGITLDTAGPAGTVVVNGGAAFTRSAGLGLALTADDGTGCGVAQMRFSEDGLTWTPWEPFAAARAFTVNGPDGPKSVYMELQDIVGNVSAVPALGSIILDTTGPVGTLAIDGGATYATVTGVSLALTADDGAGSGVADMRFSDDGVTWTAWEPYGTPKAYTLSGPDGVKTVYAEFRDVLGNVSIPAVQDAITLDANAPTGSVVIDADAAYATVANVTLTITADDGSGSGVSEMRFSEDGTVWSTWEAYSTSKAHTLTGADGPKTVYAEFRDAAGNTSTPPVQDGILLDVNAPIGTVVINAGTLYTTAAAVTLSLSGDDGTGSGVEEMRFSEDGTNWTAWEAYVGSKPFTLSGADGSKSVYVQLRDAAGNASVAPAQAVITLDTQAPTGSAVIDAGAAYALAAAVSLDLTADDGAGSGVVDMRLSQDGTNWTAWEPFAATAAYALTGVDGLKTVQVEFRDAAGNVSAPAPQDTITLDTQAPSGSLVINFGDSYTKAALVTLGLSAGDGGGSGVTEMRFSNDGASWTAWEPYTVSKSYSLSGIDGVKTVYAQYRDAVGRESVAVTDDITLDRAAPTAMISRTDPSPTASVVVHYTVTFSEPVLPVFNPSQVLVVGALAAVPTVTGTGPYTVTLFVTTPNADGLTGITLASGMTDLAGNALVVVPGNDYYIVYCPGYASEPQSADKYVGDVQSFVASVNAGPRVPAFQWKFSSGTVQDGPAAQNWDFPSLAATDAGDYWCEVTYGGLVFPTSHATLGLRNRLSITQQPTGSGVAAGATYQFTVTVTNGYAPLSYQWRKNGVDIIGAEGSSYTITGVDTSDAGDYTVEVRDANTDLVESVAATLTIESGTPVAGCLALAALAAGLAGIGARRRKK